MEFEPPSTSELAQEWIDSTFEHLLGPDGRIDESKLQERDWLFRHSDGRGLVQTNAPWYLAGEAGIGKSRLSMALCMSIASGKPFGSFVPDPQGQPVIFLTQEDDRIDKDNRFAAQYRMWDDRDPFTPEQRKNLFHNFICPPLKWGTTIDDLKRAILLEVYEKRGIAKMIVFDPLVMWWTLEGGHDDSINSASGTLKTFRTLVDFVTPPGEEPVWSLCLVHHLNKEGGTYGSAMITAQCRACFHVTSVVLEDGRYGIQVELTKVNSSPHRGFTEVFSMETDGAIWPYDARFVGSHEDILVGLVHSGRITSDMTIKNASEACIEQVALGASPECRVSNAKDVLVIWSSADPDDLAQVGITRTGSGPRSRFAPIPGYVPSVSFER